MIAPLPFALGALAWSASEYALHRFVGHGPKRKPVRGLRSLTPSGLMAQFNEEHLAHHTDPQYFAPTSKKVLAAVAVTGVVTTLGSVVVGPRRALSFALGFGMTYASYEIIHRRVHTHPPTGTFSRWVRRHHLHHHHKSPRENHGVTSYLWDRVFDTEVRIEEGQKVRVPRRAAPPWMVDAKTGDVRAEYAADYDVVGPRRAVNAEETLVIG